MLPILACGAGIYVGLHFNILALLPLSVLGAGAYLVSAWANGQGLLEFEGHTSTVQSVALSANGSRLVTVHTPIQ